MSLIVPILLRCFAVSPAPTLALRGAVGHRVFRSTQRVALVGSAPASLTLGFPGAAVGAPADCLAVRAGDLVAVLVALPSWLRSAELGALFSFRAWSAFRALPPAVGLTRRSTSLPSVAGRCAMKPRSAGYLER